MQTVKIVKMFKTAASNDLGNMPRLPSFPKIAKDAASNDTDSSYQWDVFKYQIEFDYESMRTTNQKP